MTTPVACLVTFASAAVVDGLLLWWFQVSARGQRWRAAGLSMALAMVALMGFGEALQGWWQSVSYVAGYGVGTWVAVTVSNRREP